MIACLRLNSAEYSQQAMSCAFLKEFPATAYKRTFQILVFEERGSWRSRIELWGFRRVRWPGQQRTDVVVDEILALLTGDANGTSGRLQR